MLGATFLLWQTNFFIMRHAQGGTVNLTVLCYCVMLHITQQSCLFIQEGLTISISFLYGIV